MSGVVENRTTKSRVEVLNTETKRDAIVIYFIPFKQKESISENTLLNFGHS